MTLDVRAARKGLAVTLAIAFALTAVAAWIWWFGL
jgi:hypothetical protein